MSNIEVVSLSVNVILMMVSVGLVVASWKDNKRKNSQVKIWMEQANGVHQALQRIVNDKWAGLYSGVNDMANAVFTVQASAFSLYQSLYEERILSEKEVKEHQKKIRKKIDDQMGLNESAETGDRLGNSKTKKASTKKTRGVKHG